MNLWFPALVLATAIGIGIGSAHSLLPMPDQPGTLTREKRSSLPLPATPANNSASTAVRSPALATTMIVKTSRKPVPLLRDGPPSWLDPDDDARNSADVNGADVNGATEAGRIANEAAARAAIEADGYTGVRAVNRQSGGAWSAHAQRGPTVVSVRVDANGSVSTD